MILETVKFKEGSYEVRSNPEGTGLSYYLTIGNHEVWSTRRLRFPELSLIFPYQHMGAASIFHRLIHVMGESLTQEEARLMENKWKWNRLTEGKAVIAPLAVSEESDILLPIGCSMKGYFFAPNYRDEEGRWALMTKPGRLADYFPWETVKAALPFIRSIPDYDCQCIVPDTLEFLWGLNPPVRDLLRPLYSLETIPTIEVGLKTVYFTSHEIRFLWLLLTGECYAGCFFHPES